MARVSVRRYFVACVVVTLLSSFGHLGCSDDDNNPVNPGISSTQLTGSFANPIESGQLIVEIGSATLAPVYRSGSVTAHEVTATGILTRSFGAPVHLTGTYNEETDSLNLSGGDYSLTGAYDSTGVDGVLGTYAGPNGDGFFGCIAGEPGSIDVYCGSFSNVAQTITGRWNLVVAGDNLVGVTAAVIGPSYGFEGTVSGSGPVRTVTVNQDFGNGLIIRVDGTIDTENDAATGDWRTEQDLTLVDSGIWSGSPCGSNDGVGLSSFTGCFVNADEDGLLTLTISSADLAPHLRAPSMRSHEVYATAVLTPEEGSPIHLTGTYSPHTNTFTVAHGEEAYELTGQYDSEGDPYVVPGIHGLYNGPKGPGVFAAAEGTTSSVSRYCGFFVNDANVDQGRWSGFTVAGVEVSGAMASESGRILRFRGTVTGTGDTRTVVIGGGESGSIALNGSGTLDTTTNQMSGTYTLQQMDTLIDVGVWEASLCPDGAAARPMAARAGR